MNLFWVLSQIFIVVSYSLLAITYFKKDRKSILLFGFGSLIATALSYAFLSAWSGFLMSLVAFTRNIIFLIQNKKENDTKITYIDWIILIALYSFSIVSAIFTYDGFLSLLSVIATMLYTFSVWQKNTKVYKIVGFPVSLLWIIYNIYVKSLFGCICECAILVSAVIGTIKESRKEKELINNQ